MYKLKVPKKIIWYCLVWLMDITDEFTLGKKGD